MKWPLSTIIVTSSDKAAIVDFSETVLKQWKMYSLPSLDIISHTGDIPHNTVTPIARRKNSEYQMDLVLRNNRTSEKDVYKRQVPEENSLYLKYNQTRIEIPAMDLVLYQPRELLGMKTYCRFGAEFPIRFDFLDTIGGQNLSLQVHPLTEYIKSHFGMTYTQDESYYILDCQDGGGVYLGLKDNIQPHEMIDDLNKGQKGEGSVSYTHLDVDKRQVLYKSISYIVYSYQLFVINEKSVFIVKYLIAYEKEIIILWK